jgi:hypothetical protein
MARAIPAVPIRVVLGRRITTIACSLGRGLGGDKSRAYFVPEILRRSLAKRGFRLSRMDDKRGWYDREAKGLLSPKTLAERQRRAKHREYTAKVA